MKTLHTGWRVVAAMALALVVGVFSHWSVAAAGEASGKDVAELLAMVEKYCESVDRADDGAYAEAVWLTTPNATFIHPRGHERGWDEVKRNFYGATMNDNFSKRKLKVVGDVQAYVYGDTAVLEFDWDFVATMRDDGSQKNTKGRETQVFVNIPGEGWKLAHVHYSGPPVTARGEGF